MIELVDTLFGFMRRFRPRSESAPGPLEPAALLARVKARVEGPDAEVMRLLGA